MEGEGYASSESVKGYRGAYLLIDHKAGKVISMTLWDSEEDAITDEKVLFIRNR